MAIKNYAFKNLGSFIQDNVYHIPDYQREYSWEESQVEDFWNDLKSLCFSNESEHFFGQIVVHDENEDSNSTTKYIIDGQQRTTTSIIFLSVLKQLAIEITEYGVAEAEEIAEDIKIKFIGRWTASNDRLRFRPTSIDADFFRTYIQVRSINSYNQKPRNRAQKRMKEAYQLLEKNLREEIKGRTPQEQYLIINDFFNSFIYGFKVMYVETSSLEEAFIIFESLNARGKGLETSDLLKNHLFKSSKSQIDSVKNKWEKISDNIGSSEATKFIRYYWNAIESFSRTQNLYRKMKSKINTESQVIRVISELELLSDVYTTLNANSGTSVFNHKLLNDSLKNLKSFSATSFYPIVFAMYLKNWDEKDILEVLLAIEKLIFRNIVIAKNAANKYEIIFAELAISISNNNISINEVVNNLNGYKISDEAFANHFKDLEIKNKPIIRYILKEINNLGSSKETIISDSESVHIEHILPQSPGEWYVYNHEEYVNKLGNLTLLGSEFNRKISNSLFDRKKEMYRNSEIKITRDLIDYSQWGVEEIKHRQDHLTKLALTIW
ncbi:DUF262 domain-containing protein [Exiguobacterium aestuarii]|uniref:DUF262 domain-containing protein n=1 Tax=Exiguobacterium aestuarii TaxID=273527 RepID=UPI001CD7B8AA|nr:DUF262 domain-containing protein [Exiguobacterium aestuarii]MCA0979640.1 DUF262 domain-containing HNH endonuclease family protein [Exiguobacterium aestuarii]